MEYATSDIPLLDLVLLTVTPDGMLRGLLLLSATASSCVNISCTGCQTGWHSQDIGLGGVGDAL